jgi:hypothetical protein
MIRRFVILSIVLVVWFFVMFALLGAGSHCAPASTTGTVSAQTSRATARRAPSTAPGTAPDPLASVSNTLSRDGCSVRHALVSVPEIIWHVLRPLLVAVLAFGLALIVPRWIARSRRRYVRLNVAAYRGEAAEPDAIRAMLESFHQQLLTRWWLRIVNGQPSIAFEVALRPDAEGDLSGQMSIVCPDYLAEAVAGTFSACYRDSRLVLGGALPPASRVVRLKKHNNLVRALGQMDDEAHKLMDSLLAQMTALESPAVVQFACTPTPALFDRYRRWRYAEFERRAERGHVLVDARVPGLRSFGLGQELEGGLRVLHRPLFFTDIRVAGPTMRAATSVAGTLRGESAAENRLAIRNVQLRTALYLGRIAAGTANPIPGWRRGVVSSVELAAMWHLPSPALKGARMPRLTTPRLLAPSEVSRAPEHALMRDERGPVGVLPEDKTDGLGLIGGQKTGKTSVLCRTVRADALDKSCAMVVLMPKPGDALKALSTIPKDRVVHYLDLEKPEFGINPLLTGGDPAMVADKIVEAFRDVNMEGDIRGSSDRYLRQAAQAAIGASRAGVIDGPPTLWHMYRILMPSEETFRERVVEALMPDPRYVDTATFFGRELPIDLRDATSTTTAKLDAPRNKIIRLLVESLDKVLRHPRQLLLDDIVRRREVLIVDGKMGTFGSDNTRVMLQFILNNLYGTLQRQQQLPEHERVRVALKVDEAHLVLNESFADALATLRSAGLEVVAAWQYGEQIQDPKIRSGMMSLLRQRCMFSMGEREDTRDMSAIAMSSYSDMIRSDPEERLNLRVTPDIIFNLPNHHAICSWISRGARAPAFLAQTYPLEANEDVIRHHLDAQRERGGHVPTRLPDPLPDVNWRGLFELPSGAISTNGSNRRAQDGTNGRAQDGVNGTAHGAAPPVDFDAPTLGLEPASLGDADTLSGDAATAEGPAFEFDPAATSVDRPDEQPGAGPRVGAPNTFSELDLDDIRGLIWDKATHVPGERQPDPTTRELEILAALWSHRFLFSTQIHRRWWRGSSVRAAQQTLNKMMRAGWVRRFKFQRAERGAQQRVYCLARDGFELAKANEGRRGSYIPATVTWREPQISDPRRILRDLHANGWVMAVESLCGRSFAGWRGPRESRLDPPRRKVKGEWLDIRPPAVTIGGRKLHDYASEKFESVNPDATIELKLEVGDAPLRLDLLIEFERSTSPGALEDRLRRYDGLISGWASLLDRYRALGTPPVVVFVCEDERAQSRLVRLADKVVTARLAKAGAEEADWPCPGRKAMFFALERDAHMGTLEALQLSEHPPAVRVRLGGPGERESNPWRMHIIEPRLLGRR